MKKHTIREIREGRNLEQNLPVFLSETASVNHVYAVTSFAMQYFSFYEALVDGDTVLMKELEPVWKNISRMVRENFFDSFDGELREKSIGELDQLRKEITAKMRVLTTYTDIFGLYEYVMNRLEPEFEERLADADNDAVAREILQYIFMEQDNVVINDRIHQMLSQLPVRMSRGKFCDLVKAGMEIYLESDRSSVEDFIYRVESAAGLYRPEGFEEYFPEIAAFYKEMAAADLKNMDAGAYERYSGILKKAVDLIVQATDNYYGIMEIVNLLYAWLLNFPYASVSALQMTEPLNRIIREVCSNVEEEHYENITEELVQEFEKAEGVLEEYSVTMQKLQGLLEEIGGNAEKEISALLLDKLYVCLLRSSGLLSGSLFVDLDRQIAAEEEKADRAFLDQRAEELSTKLLHALSEQQKPLNRAMIAAVLHELPVFFNSQNEVMDYVRGSLAGCHDLAEKTASVRLMKTLMEE